MAWNIKLNGAFRPLRPVYKLPPINCIGLYSVMQVMQSNWWRAPYYLIINKRVLINIDINTLRILINFSWEKFLLKEGKLKGIVEHGCNTKPDWDSFYHRRCWQRLILSKGLLKNGCQQNSHGTEKTWKYLFAVLILLTLMEMLSQRNEIFSIEATHV